MNTELIRKKLEDIAAALSPNSLPLEAEMDDTNKALIVRREADQCFDIAHEALTELSKQPDHATRYGHCSGCKTGGTHYMGTVEHPENAAPVLVALSDCVCPKCGSSEVSQLDKLHNACHVCDKVWNINANTRAVSVDQLVEVVTEVLDGMDNSTSFIYVDDLREAFTKLVTTNEHGKI
jgi:hypothetical protein